MSGITTQLYGRLEVISRVSTTIKISIGLKYACENKCPYDVTALIDAIEHGQFECAKYLYDRGMRM